MLIKEGDDADESREQTAVDDRTKLLSVRLHSAIVAGASLKQAVAVQLLTLGCLCLSFIWQKNELRLAKETRVRTSFGLGSVTDYRSPNDSYAVQLDCGSVGYFQAKDVACVDLRLLSKVPKPLSAERIYDEFQGRITRDDALVLSLKAKQTYRQLQIFCEQHAEAISFISTNASYGDQYTSSSFAAGPQLFGRYPTFKSCKRERANALEGDGSVCEGDARERPA